MSHPESIFGASPSLPPWVGQLAKYLGAAWPNWKPTAATMVVYYDALRDIDPRHIGEAAKILVRTAGEFAPSAGTIREEALALRRAKRAHPPECDCLACVNALPVAERWLRLSPSMRTILQREQPDLARQLAEAVPPQVRERVEGTRRLLGFAKPIPAKSERAAPTWAEQRERFLGGAGGA